MKNNDYLFGKRLLILGGNSETAAIVRYAKSFGVYTIVIDPNPHSPAKKDAAEAYDVEVMNVHALLEKVKHLNLDGILVGVADILVPSYYKICKYMNFPCYATLDSIETFTTKNGFRHKCEKHGIGVIPYYAVSEKFTDSEVFNINFPVLVKPVDNGGGVGMNISNSIQELRDHVSMALQHSKRKEFLVEKYMECDDMLVYYTISDGIAYLSAAADRFTTKIQRVGSPVCSLAVYPSKYLNAYLDQVHDKVVNLIHDTGVENGVLNIQFFVDQGNFYAYDPGFRLQGEAPHLYLKKINDFDNREMLINFALTSNAQQPDLIFKNDPFFKGKHAATLWILLREGEIGSIIGLEQIEKHQNVLQIIQRLFVGEKVSREMIGTEKQVFARFYMVADSKSELRNTIEFVQEYLKVYDNKNTDMILELFDINKTELK